MTKTINATPPYMSVGVFSGAIQTLAESVVPTGAIDRRVLNGMSGADYGSLISGLRFLGFVDENRKATQQYRDLVKMWKEDKNRYNATLLATMIEAYSPMLDAVDIHHGTAAELEKAFRDAGVTQGQMLTKTVRFYVKMLEELGVEVSPHITKAPRRAKVKSNGDKPKPKPAKKTPPRRRTPDQEDAQLDRPGDGFERLPVPGLAGAFIQYPSDLTEIHCSLFEAMVGVLRTYVKGRTGGKEKKS